MLWNNKLTETTGWKNKVVLQSSILYSSYYLSESTTTEKMITWYDYDGDNETEVISKHGNRQYLEFITCLHRKK